MPFSYRYSNDAWGAATDQVRVKRNAHDVHNCVQNGPPFGSLMLGTGTGSEIRRPLGYAMVGGLFVSEAMTLLRERSFSEQAITGIKLMAAR